MAPVPEEEPSRTSNEVSDMETPPINIALDSEESDSDEEHEAHVQMGYQPLPQDPNALGDTIQEDDDDDEDTDAMETRDNANAQPNAVDLVIAQSLDRVQYPAVGSNFPDNIPDAELEERKEVWKKPQISAPMSQDDAEKIKNAMMSFKLPPCAHPEWAKAVSEDEWKQRLYTKLNIPVSSSYANTTQKSPSTSHNDASTSQNTEESISVTKVMRDVCSSKTVRDIKNENDAKNTNEVLDNESASHSSPHETNLDKR